MLLAQLLGTAPGCDDATAFGSAACRPAEHQHAAGRDLASGGAGARLWLPPIGCPGAEFRCLQPHGRPGTAGRTGFHLANAAARTLGAHALHNRFVAGRLGVANVHGRTFAQAATFRGHFANRSWHRHHHFPKLIVLGWAGPLFWPYAYDDFVGYTFYPYAYDTFWPYAYDDVYDGIFGRYAYGNAPVRVVAGEPAPDGTVTAPATATRRSSARAPTSARQTRQRA